MKFIKFPLRKLAGEPLDYDLIFSSYPLTASLRNGFANILSLPSKNTFFKNKIKDIFAVITIMLLFFIYIFVDIFLLQASHIC